MFIYLLALAALGVAFVNGVGKHNKTYGKSRGFVNRLLFQGCYLFYA